MASPVRCAPLFTPLFAFGDLTSKNFYCMGVKVVFHLCARRFICSRGCFGTTTQNSKRIHSPRKRERQIGICRGVEKVKRRRTNLVGGDVLDAPQYRILHLCKAVAREWLLRRHEKDQIPLFSGRRGRRPLQEVCANKVRDKSKLEAPKPNQNKNKSYLGSWVPK